MIILYESYTFLTEGIIEYLGKYRDEYITHPKDVDRGYKEGKRLVDTIKVHDMTWTHDFIGGTGTYDKGYVTHLRKAKVPMREAVFGFRK
jgi:hypothetical protein